MAGRKRMVQRTDALFFKSDAISGVLRSFAFGENDALDASVAQDSPSARMAHCAPQPSTARDETRGVEAVRHAIHSCPNSFSS
jgi:hypothetical protein